MCLQVALSMVIHGRCTLYNVSVEVKVVAHHVGGRHQLGHVFIYKSRNNHPHHHPSLRGGALASNSA